MSRRFTRILVPFDFDSASEAALACAKELALRFNAHLFLLHIIEDPLAGDTATLHAHSDAIAQLREVLLSNARQQLEAAVNKYERERFRVEIHLRVGTVADSISQFARENVADLIVMGAHERGGPTQGFTTNVAERLVRTAPCPVLTTRGRDRRTPESAGAFEISGPWALSSGCE